MRQLWRNNNLSLVLVAMFIAAIFGQSVAGLLTYNEEQQTHEQQEVSYAEYVTSGHFLGAVFENWESEFLQDAVYVLLTVFLVQRGSAESKDPDKSEAVDADPGEARNDPQAPWPVRRGGAWLTLYKHSLFITFFVLFLLTLSLHALNGVREYNQQQIEHGESPIAVLEFVFTSQFWFESLQNWQSEFLALLSIVVLSIFLRQQGSPESKPVASPHSETGSA